MNPSASARDDPCALRRDGLQRFFLCSDKVSEPRKAAHMTDRKTISIMKACELVGVSRRTIYNWIASGKVEYIRTAGGSVRIFVDTLWRQPGQSNLTSKEAS
jgi:excisionase family DNA binding protein